MSTDPRLWWWLSGVCFYWAGILIWRDEYEARRRLETEQTGPQVTLEFDDSAGSNWVLVNSGADAFNVESSPIRYGNRFALIYGIPKIARGNRVQLTFNIFHNDGRNLLPHAPDLLHIFRAVLNNHSVPESEFSHEINIPVSFTYIDAFSRTFETVCEIQWDLAGNHGHVVHRVIRRSATASWHKRLIGRFLRPWVVSYG